MENNYLDTKGRIFDIQRFSIHDGTGIRTIVFFKGCVLRCRWCCNPESQNFDIETMMVNGKPKVMGKDVTVAQVLETIRRDMPYYARSQGGITLSGGEALLQPDFAAALLRGASEMGVNTALESMACVKYESIEKVLPYLDTYLMDIKHMNGEKHREFTGRENSLMLENAMKVAQSGACELIIRVPVVPGFNATEAELLDIAKFADTLPGVSQIHILPYHSYGEGKYTGLGRDYPMGDTKSPSDEQMRSFKAAIEAKTSLRCQIGG